MKINLIRLPTACGGRAMDWYCKQVKMGLNRTPKYTAWMLISALVFC